MKNMMLVAGLLAVSTAVCAAQGLAPTKPADNVAPTKAELQEMYNTATVRLETFNSVELSDASPRLSRHLLTAS